METCTQTCCTKEEVQKKGGQPGFVLYGSVSVAAPASQSLQKAALGWRSIATQAKSFDVRCRVRSIERDGQQVRSMVNEVCRRCGADEKLALETSMAAEWMGLEFKRRLGEKYTDEDICMRLALLRRTQCPKLHYDNVPMRALATLVGPGTLWADADMVDWESFKTLRSQGASADDLEKGTVPSGLRSVPDSSAIFMTPPTLHRSPRYSDTRVLLQCDVASAVLD